MKRIPTREELVCLICHKPGVALDHIRERSLAPELKSEPWNIAPLCPACHDLKHQKRILTKAQGAAYWWKQRGAGHPWIRVPVRVNKRHGCLDFAEAESAAADRAGSSTEERLADTQEYVGSTPTRPDSAAAPPASPLSTAAEPGAPTMSAHSVMSGPDSAAAPSVPGTVFAEDWSGLSDDELQLKYDTADQMQGMAFLLKCKAVHTYRENHVQVWGKSWTEHAIERFNISRRYCFAFANLWEISVSIDTSLVTPLTDSKSLMQAIGRRSLEDGKAAMEAAVAHHAEYAEPPTVGQLEHTLGVEREPRPELMGLCFRCGAEGALSEFRRV